MAVEAFAATAWKSGFVQIAEATRTAAMTHGALRYLAGFDLRQLAAEFRALRASVQSVGHTSTLRTLGRPRGVERAGSRS